jgi:hypothetical protein
MFKTRVLRRIPVFTVMLVALMLLGATAAFAAGAGDFEGNITNLISTTSTWTCGLSAGAGGLMMAYHAVMRNLNDDPQAVAHHTGSMKKVLTGTAIATGSTGIVAIVSSAFGGSATTGMLILHASRFFC